MTLQPLIFRADSSIAMGTGHVMRCLALAQAWRDAGGSCVFVMRESTLDIARRLEQEAMEVISIRVAASASQDASIVGELLRRYDASWVVMDGYQFDHEYQHVLKTASAKVLCIDDQGAIEHYSADLVLNQNAHARRELYSSREPNTRLLLGPRYALLRSEFDAFRNFKRVIPPRAKNLLVTMGGSDPDNLTLRVLEALQTSELDSMRVNIVIGGSNPHFEILNSTAACLPDVQLLRNPENMPELMAWADVAISAAGSTCWEMCLLGLPAILIDLAPNQSPVAHELSRRRVSSYAGSARTIESSALARQLSGLINAFECRSEMCLRGQALVDGRGAARVVDAIRNGNLSLRRVEESDCRLIWNWANDSVVRAVSFSSDPIPWEQHVQWFRRKLVDPRVLHYLVLSEDQIPLGQVRYELEGSTAVMSINTAPEFRGRGYGAAMISLTAEELFRQTNAKAIHAYVKANNEPSMKLFASSGFVRESTLAIEGQGAVKFVLERPAGS